MRKDLRSLYAATIKRATPANEIIVCKNILQIRVGSGSGPLPIRGLGLESGVDRVEIAADGRAESPDRTNAHDGDQADEQTILDEGRTLVGFS
jgi:hypothetical protein